MLSKFDENINIRTHRGSLNLKIFLHTKPPHVVKVFFFLNNYRKYIKKVIKL